MARIEPKIRWSVILIVGFLLFFSFSARSQMGNDRLADISVALNPSLLPETPILLLAYESGKITLSKGSVSTMICPHSGINGIKSIDSFYNSTTEQLTLIVLDRKYKLHEFGVEGTQCVTKRFIPNDFNIAKIVIWHSDDGGSYTFAAVSSNGILYEISSKFN